MFCRTGFKLKGKIKETFCFLDNFMILSIRVNRFVNFKHKERDILKGQTDKTLDSMSLNQILIPISQNIIDNLKGPKKNINGKKRK